MRRRLVCLPVMLSVVAFASLASAQDEPQDKGPESRKAATKKLMDKVQEEYRLFYHEPKNALEYWAAIEFEMTVGKFDIAAFLVEKLLKLSDKEADQDLLRIEEAKGLSAFVRLKQVKQWNKQPELDADARKNADLLVERVLSALEKAMSDPERLGRFIAGLSDPVPEVRAFSLYQLKRAKYRAAPVLADALRNSKPREQAVLKKALVDLEPDLMPALLELYRAHDAKDAANAEFRLGLLELAKIRADMRVVPYLWHLSAGKEYPEIVRDKAKEVLAYLLNTTPGQLQSAAFALTQLAEQYYRYQIPWPDVTQVADREKPDKQLVMPAYRKWYLTPEGRLSAKAEVLRPDDARLDFGLRYARQAVELDPAYMPAQEIYLAFLLEAEFTRRPYEGRLDKLLTVKRPPALQRLLAKIHPDLVASLVERAADEQNFSVLLPLIDALGDRADVRLAQSSGAGTPGLLIKMLYYPDRRVQYAAARALLKLPVSPTPLASTRIVEILAHFLATDPAPKVLIIAGGTRPAVLRAAAKDAGYDADTVANVNEAVNLLHQSAEYDAILLDNLVPSNEWQFALTHLRADPDGGGLPLLLIAPAGREGELQNVAGRNRNTFVVPDVWASKGPELKKQIEDAIKFAAAPLPLRKAPRDQQAWLKYEVRRGAGQAVSEAEKKLFAAEALDWFAQMARGELPGYDLRPAKDALIAALNVEDTAQQALRVLARFPATDTQNRLADIILSGGKATLPQIAARELNRHVQKNGLALNDDRVKLLRDLELKADLEPTLRSELAVLVGTLRTTSVQTGSRLLGYVPDIEPAAKEAAPKGPAPKEPEPNN